MNLIDARLEAGKFRIGERQIDTGLDASGLFRIGIRPEAIRIADGMPAKVALVENLGARFLIEARVDGVPLMVLADERPAADSLQLQIDPKDIHVFDKESGKNIRSALDSRRIHP